MGYVRSTTFARGTVGLLVSTVILCRAVISKYVTIIDGVLKGKYE